MNKFIQIMPAPENLFCPFLNEKCKNDKCYFFTAGNACLIYDGLQAMVDLTEDQNAERLKAAGKSERGCCKW